MWPAAIRTWACAPAPGDPISSTLSGSKPGRLRPACTYIDGEFDKRGSLIHRYGTLNGIATADVSSVHVAGGYILANGRKSPYSSAGPARGGSRLRSRLRAALRRVLRSPGHPCRRQQKRQRVSPDRHQRRGAATGTMDFRHGDASGNRHPGHSFGNCETGRRKSQTAVTRRRGSNQVPAVSRDGGGEWVGTSQ